MFVINKEFHFSASHRLDLPDGHPCSRLHGHNYVVILSLASKKLDGIGFVRDYRDLDMFKKWIDGTLDHRHLNDIMVTEPTAEHIAQWIFNCWMLKIPQLVSVTVKETDKTSATYYFDEEQDAHEGK